MQVTIVKYKKYTTISHLPGSGGWYKLTLEMLRVIKEQMEADDETTVSQLVRQLNAQGLSISKPQSYKHEDFRIG